MSRERHRAAPPSGLPEKGPLPRCEAPAKELRLGAERSVTAGRDAHHLGAGHSVANTFLP